MFERCRFGHIVDEVGDVALYILYADKVDNRFCRESGRALSGVPFSVCGDSELRT